MVILYTLVHFYCTISVIQLYRGTDFIYFLSCVSMKVYINHVFNHLVKKMMNDLGSNFFPQTSLSGKVLEFPCGS